AERCMAEVMRKRECFCKVFIEPKRTTDRPRHLRYFQTMGQPCTVMIALMIHEYLRLIFKATEGGGMDDAVAIALEEAACIALRFSKTPPPAGIRRTGIGCGCNR